MRTQSRQQLKFQALLAALLPPRVESSERPRVLALLRARGTPKHVLTSCAAHQGVPVSLALFRVFPSGARNLLRACGITTAALRQGVLFQGCCVLDYGYASR